MNAVLHTAPNSGKPIQYKDKRGVLSELIKNKGLYLLSIPGILFFLVFCYLPLVGIVISFKNYNVIDGIFGSPFVGLKNFQFLLKSRDLPQITYNTVFLNALFIVFGMFAQVLAALTLNEIRSNAYKAVSQGFLLLPYFISWVTVGVITYYIFGTEFGFLNGILKALGFAPVEWYNSPQYWPAILTFVYIWKWVGYGSIIYLSAIVGIDQEIYESARIDGCSEWQVIRHITVPLLAPTMMIMTLLALGRIFYGDFGMILNIVRNNIMLFKTTNIIDTYVYRALMGVGMSGGNIAMASAAGFMQSVLGFITILAANLIVRKVNSDYALF